MDVGPLRVAAGVVRLRAVRMRDGVQWSRIRLADRAHLEPWEPSAEGDWATRHAVSAWPALCSGLRSEARKGRMLPYVIELDGRFCGQLTILRSCNGLHVGRESFLEPVMFIGKRSERHVDQFVCHRPVCFKISRRDDSTETHS